MAAVIIFAVVLASCMGALGWFFYRKGRECWKSGRRVRGVFAWIGLIVAAGLLIGFVVQGFSINSGRIWAWGAICVLIGTVLTWIAACFVKKIGRRVLLIMSPIPFYVVLFLWTLEIALGGDIPVFKNEVEYKEQADLAKVLGTEDLPDMKFDGARNFPYGYKVHFKLVDEADSNRLTAVYDRLKKDYPLQIMETDYTGRMYMWVDNDSNRYVNTVFDKDKMKVVYGKTWGKEGGIKSNFDSINASLPEYKYITFMPQSFGPDWSVDERVEFVEPISSTWPAKIKNAAKSREGWSYEEDREAYNIKYKASQCYIHIILYKKRSGKRKIADISWGSR